jgi:hypothetical protein
LKHDITNEMLEERLREGTALEGRDGNVIVDRNKGKGKEVYVEDGSDEEELWVSQIGVVGSLLIALEFGIK